MNPLDLLAPQPAGAFGKEPAWNAWVELHNLVVAAEQAADFGPSDLDRIGERHGVDLRAEFRGERVGLYGDLLAWRLANGAFDEADRAFVAHVAAALGLTAADVRDAHERAFGKAVSAAISDDCLSVEERLLLYTLQHTLGLDPELAAGAYEVMAREKLTVAIARVLCDGTLSPEEADEVRELEASLDVPIPPRLAELLDAAAQRWAARHGRLQPVPTVVRLRKGETAYFSGDGRWRRLNTPAMRRAMTTMGARDAVATGRTESFAVPNVALDGHSVDGHIVITDERFVLTPLDGPTITRSLSSIRRVYVFSNGLALDMPDERDLLLDARHLTPLLGDVIQGLRGGSPPPSSETFKARWRKFPAAERDVALAQVSRNVPVLERRDALLGRVSRFGPWNPYGLATLSPSRLLLKASRGSASIARDDIDGVHRNRRLVWLARGRRHDWLLEFESEAQAKRFADELT